MGKVMTGLAVRGPGQLVVEGCRTPRGGAVARAALSLPVVSRAGRLMAGTTRGGRPCELTAGMTRLAADACVFARQGEERLVPGHEIGGKRNGLPRAGGCCWGVNRLGQWRQRGPGEGVRVQSSR